MMTPTRRLLLAAALTLSAAPAARAECACDTCASGTHQVFRTVTDTMKPTLEADACAIFDTAATANRGDIIIVRTMIDPEILHAVRLIGLPGDTVEMQEGQVILNGTALPQTLVEPYQQQMVPEGPYNLLPRCPAPTAEGATCEIQRLTETLPDGTSYDILNLHSFRLVDTMQPRTVPSDYVFVLGDHRDIALDSRFSPAAFGMGLIYREDILGSVVKITNPPPP